MLNIDFDIGSMLDLDHSRQDARTQRNLDNEWRLRYYLQSKYEGNRAYEMARDRNREDDRRWRTNLNNIARQAKEVGISTLAALGQQGHTPAAFAIPGSTVKPTSGGVTPSTNMTPMMRFQLNQAQKQSNMDMLEQEARIIKTRTETAEIEDRIRSNKFDPLTGKPMYNWYYDNSPDRPAGTIAVPVEEMAEGMEGKWPGRFMLYGNRGVITPDYNIFD